MNLSDCQTQDDVLAAASEDREIMEVQLIQDGFHFLIRALNPSAKAWLEENTDGQWFGRSLFVEGRHIEDLIRGFQQAGGTLA